MDQDRICLKILKEMKDNYDCRSWFGHLKSILEELQIENNDLICDDLKGNRWNAEAEKRPKLDFYRKIFSFDQCQLQIMHNEDSHTGFYVK